MGHLRTTEVVTTGERQQERRECVTEALSTWGAGCLKWPSAKLEAVHNTSARPYIGQEQK